MISDPLTALLYDPEPGTWTRFGRPDRVIEAGRLDQVVPALDEIERAVDAGRLAVGFVSYEAAPAFDDALTTLPSEDIPLVWFALFEPGEVRQIPDPALALRGFADRFEPDISHPPGVDSYDAYQLGPWTADTDRRRFDRTVRRIKAYIAEGDTYQVNYTHRLRTSFRGDALRFFLDLAARQPDGYPAFIDAGRWVVCSASPELFFRKTGLDVLTRPMKGTRSRGLRLDDDRRQAEALLRSEKDRAENLMIVDMLRNDLGRVAEQGSVAVSELFEVERHPTVWQMTSTVTGRSRVSWARLMAALFPCASVTGAPKASTMGIIRAIEPSPRGLYTGAIGRLGPGGDSLFSVAIRTVVIDRLEERAEYGIGSGIVWDSSAEREFEECRTKARVLTAPAHDFELLETFRWTIEEGYALRERHVRRLLESAAYFGFHVDAEAVERALDELAATLDAHPRRVRLLAGATGVVRTEVSPLDRPTNSERPFRLVLDARPVDAANPLLYHKTTARRIYDDARRRFPGADDVLLWNERGELTESCLANVVVRLDGTWYTPPVSCGLLAGTYRDHLLEEGLVVERVIRIEELERADEMALINSVRGWIRGVQLSPRGGT